MRQRTSAARTRRRRWRCSQASRSAGGSSSRKSSGKGSRTSRRTSSRLPAQTVGASASSVRPRLWTARSPCASCPRRCSRRIRSLRFRTRSTRSRSKARVSAGSCSAAPEPAASRLRPPSSPTCSHSHRGERRATSQLSIPRIRDRLCACRDGCPDPTDPPRRDRRPARRRRRRIHGPRGARDAGRDLSRPRRCSCCPRWPAARASCRSWNLAPVVTVSSAFLDRRGPGCHLPPFDFDRSWWFGEKRMPGIRSKAVALLVGSVAAAIALAAFSSGGVARRAAAAEADGQSHSITWDGYSLKIDGKRLVVWSGEMHPFRLPSPSLWRDILEKMKANGYNAVSIYVDWGYHSPKPGVYDFTGVRDLDRFFDIASDAGIYVIARPG